VSVPESFRRFWSAFDELAADVQPTSWGAIVSDPRSPDVWDTNYARVDAPRPVTVEEVEDALLPVLRSSGVSVEHVVSLRHEAHRELLDALTARGHGFGWDPVMAHEERVPERNGATVEELVDPDELPTVVAAVLREGFAHQPDTAVDQLVRLDRDVMRPGGKRWFGVRDDGRVVAAGTLIVLGEVAYVDDVATFPGFRGRGYATAVVTRILREAAAIGVEDVYLLADPDEPRVIAIYARLGFHEVGRLASTRGPTPAA